MLRLFLYNFSLAIIYSHIATYNEKSLCFIFLSNSFVSFSFLIISIAFDAKCVSFMLYAIENTVSVFSESIYIESLTSCFKVLLSPTCVAKQRYASENCKIESKTLFDTSEVFLFAYIISIIG